MNAEESGSLRQEPATSAIAGRSCVAGTVAEDATEVELLLPCVSDSRGRPPDERRPRVSIRRRVAGPLASVSSYGAVFVARPSIGRLVLAFPISHTVHGLAARVATVTSLSTTGKEQRREPARSVAIVTKIFLVA